MADAQDRAEATDSDKVDPDFPPDEPMGVDEEEVTPEGEWERESFEERTEREEPEARDGADPNPDPDRPEVVPYSEDSSDIVDDEAAAVADAEVDQRDVEADGAPLPAEESAIHIDSER